MLLKQLLCSQRNATQIANATAPSMPYEHFHFVLFFFPQTLLSARRGQREIDTQGARPLYHIPPKPKSTGDAIN